jgi:hypothetical protein
MPEAVSFNTVTGTLSRRRMMNAIWAADWTFGTISGQGALHQSDVAVEPLRISSINTQCRRLIGASHAATRRLASAYSVGARACSNSRMMPSAPLAVALVNRSGRSPGARSRLRGFAGLRAGISDAESVARSLAQWEPADTRQAVSIFEYLFMR